MKLMYRDWNANLLSNSSLRHFWRLNILCLQIIQCTSSSVEAVTHTVYDDPTKIYCYMSIHIQTDDKLIQVNKYCPSECSYCWNVVESRSRLLILLVLWRAVRGGRLTKCVTGGYWWLTRNDANQYWRLSHCYVQSVIIGCRPLACYPCVRDSDS